MSSCPVNLERPSHKVQPTILPSVLDERIVPPSPYAALIFDCDGTLADTLPVHFQAWKAAFGKVGNALTEEWYSDRTGFTASEFIRSFNQTFGYDLDEQLVDAKRQQHFVDLIHYVQPVAAVAAIAQAHYGSVPMAVASNGQRSVVESTIEAIRLRSLFETIVTLNDVQVGKPAPDLFLLAAERMSVSPHQCIVYEDSDLGLEAAERAGMRWIDVRVLGQAL
jgi:HAD superfamily hydrolase (TIGR01509 family)